MAEYISLEPGTIYADIDDAVHAACCLAYLHKDGATVYGTTDGIETAQAGPACLESGEAYIVSTKAVQRGGATWDVPNAPYEAIYTITRCKVNN